MALLYDDPQRAALAYAIFHALVKGRQPMEHYVADLRKWAADTDLNDSALFHQFQVGLSDSIKDELARASTLDALNQLAIKLD